MTPALVVNVALCRDGAPTTVVLTDAPEVVALKREFARLDAWHEVVKQWPHGPTRAAALELVCQQKADIAQKVARGGAV